MGCFCSCFRLRNEEQNYDVVVSDNHDVSNKQNCAPLSYVAEFFKNKYGVVSSNSGLQTLPASAQGTYIATTEVGTNTPRDILLENGSSSGNLELQGSVAVVGNGAGLGTLQLEHRPTEGHKVRVKGTQGATDVGSNAPQGILLQNSSSSRNRELQGNVPVQENGAGSGPLQLEHRLPEGHNVQVNLSSKSQDNMKLRRRSKGKADGFSKDNKAEAGVSASPAYVSTEKVKTEHNDYFYLTRDEVECPTCLEEYNVENPRITSKCNHHFHLGCIYEWMERSTTCPICSEVMEFAEIV